MVPTYNVYLSKSNTDPEAGTEGTDWVYFECQFLQHPVKVTNPKRHLLTKILSLSKLFLHCFWLH